MLIKYFPITGHLLHLPETMSCPAFNGLDVHMYRHYDLKQKLIDSTITQRDNLIIVIFKVATVFYKFMFWIT